MAFSDQRVIADNADLSSCSRTNSQFSSATHTSVTKLSPLFELAKECYTLLESWTCWKKSKLMEDQLEDAITELASLCLTSFGFVQGELRMEHGEIILSEEICEAVLRECRLALEISKDFMIRAKNVEEGQTEIFNKEEIVALQNRIKAVWDKLRNLGLDWRYLKIVGCVFFLVSLMKHIFDNSDSYRQMNNNWQESYMLDAKDWDISLLPQLVRGLEEAYRDFDPVGYRQYRTSIDLHEKELNTSTDTFHDVSVDKSRESVNESIALCSSAVKVKSQSIYSLESEHTAVNETNSTDPEKEEETDVYYAAWVLRHVPAHIQELRYRLFMGLKCFTTEERVHETWSVDPLRLHSSEIEGFKQRFKDATRRKMYGCGMQMEIKAGGEVERKMQEDYVNEIVKGLGEKAEKQLLDLCFERGQRTSGMNVKRKWEVVAIEARGPQGLFGEAKMIGLEESVKMKKNMEWERRNWWKRITDVGCGREWWKVAESVEWVVVIKGEEVD